MRERKRQGLILRFLASIVGWIDDSTISPMPKADLGEIH